MMHRDHLWLGLWALFVLVLLLLPAQFVSETSDRFDMPMWIDKVIHFVLFGILCYLARRSFARVEGLRWPLFWAFAAASLYGVALEYLQLISAARSGEALDAAANAAGAACALALPLRRKRPLEEN